MACVGHFGTFIHIPKTGGQWMRQLLRKNWSVKEDGPYHGLPLTWGHRTFTIIRHPGDWLRSVHGHLEPDDPLKSARTESPMWNDLVRILAIHWDTNFDEFISKLYPEQAGIVDWFWQMYLPPMVEFIIRTSALEEGAKVLFGDVQLPPEAVNVNENLVDMPFLKDTWIAIENSEPNAVNFYSSGGRAIDGIDLADWVILQSSRVFELRRFSNTTFVPTVSSGLEL